MLCHILFHDVSLLYFLLALKVLLTAMTDNEEILTSKISDLLKTPVESDKDKEMANTCYEAELPLSMAAWNGDKETVATLIKYGASLEWRNNKDDNIFHSLIRVSGLPYTRDLRRAESVRPAWLVPVTDGSVSRD